MAGSSRAGGGSFVATLLSPKESVKSHTHKSNRSEESSKRGVGAASPGAERRTPTAKV